MTPETKRLNIVIPLAGMGTKFKEAGYAFPKALVDIQGQTMIERVVKNIRPQVEHRFIFVCQREQYETYDLHNVFKRATGDAFEVIKLHGPTEGAACTVLAAIERINNDEPLLVANADQFIRFDVDGFLRAARTSGADGMILTFRASHPKWSYVRVGGSGDVLETAEKKVISDRATAGLYYFRQGADFIRGTQAMILKNIRYNKEFYVCPVYNELILQGKRVQVFEIPPDAMHSLGTPEDVQQLLRQVEEGKLVL
jgi:NDP-sugar pyrophosphorylase family protein